MLNKNFQLQKSFMITSSQDVVGSQIYSISLYIDNILDSEASPLQVVHTNA